MYIISRRALQQFWIQHPDSQPSLSRWYKIMEQSDFTSFNELCLTFPSADKVGNLVVFNISGNKYRLIASIHFNRSKVYIRYVLTHAECSRGVWRE